MEKIKLKKYFFLISIPFLFLVVMGGLIRDLIYIAANDYFQLEFYYLSFQYLQKHINYYFFFGLLSCTALFAISIFFLRKTRLAASVILSVFTIEICALLALFYLSVHSVATVESSLQFFGYVWTILRELRILFSNLAGPVLIILSILALLLGFLVIQFFSRPMRTKVNESLGGWLVLPSKALLVASILTFAVLAILNIAAWVTNPAVAERPFNVIFITWDSMRADHLSCYGYPRDTSPNVDAFAEKSIQFERAISQHNWTKLSYASMLTSRYCWEFHEQLGPSQLTLAEVLKNHGYETFGIVQNPWLDPVFNFVQGFDNYTRINGPVESARFSGSPKEVNQIVLKNIDSMSQSEKPFFLFVHYIRPHFPYPRGNHFISEFLQSTPELMTANDVRHLMGEDRGKDWDASHPSNEKKIQYLIDMYDATVREVDEAFGDLLKSLDKKLSLDNSMIIFNSDHGDEFYDHQGFGHAHTNLHDEVISVPLVIHFPDQTGVTPRKVSDTVTSLDIFPTILDVLGISSPKMMRGQSLLPLLNSQPSDPRLAFSYHFNPPAKPNIKTEQKEKLVAVTSDRYRLIVDYSGHLSDQFFDLKLDPKERASLPGLKGNEDYVKMKLAADTWYAEYESREPMSESVSSDSIMIRKLRDKLKSLGYIN